VSKASLKNLLNVLQNTATESDATVEKVQVRFWHLKDTCSHFNVDRGLHDKTPGVERTV
jgi:hypothetical protein